MKGFLFKIKIKQLNSHYYFIETNHERKTKTIANKFLKYFMEKYEGCGFIPLTAVQNTFNKIYKEMYNVTLIDKSNDLKCYHIHTKYSGESVPMEAVTIIKGVE